MSNLVTFGGDLGTSARPGSVFPHKGRKAGLEYPIWYSETSRRGECRSAVRDADRLLKLCPRILLGQVYGPEMAGQILNRRASGPGSRHHRRFVLGKPPNFIEITTRTSNRDLAANGSLFPQCLEDILPALPLESLHST